LTDQRINCCVCRRPMAPGFLFGLVSARDVIGAWNPLNCYCYVGKKYRQRARTCLPAAGHGEEARARKMSRGAAPRRSTRRAGARFRAWRAEQNRGQGAAGEEDALGKRAAMGTGRGRSRGRGAAGDDHLHEIGCAVGLAGVGERVLAVRPHRRPPHHPRLG
jgi:hypothetical protein